MKMPMARMGAKVADQRQSDKWFWAFGLLGFWAFGLLGFWAFGLLGFWAFGLLGFWAFGANLIQ